MRHASKDRNHDVISRRFIDMGCSAIDLVNTGIPGWPDLAVGCMGVTHLVEVKNLATAYGRKGFNANQTAFNRDWRGEKVYLCEDVEQATDLVIGWRSALVNQWRKGG